MRVVVFSDSHHNVAALKRICLVQQDADLFLHLGDGQGDIAALQKALPELPLKWVRGNCDLSAWGELELVLDLEGTRMLAVHGHTLSVKFGLKELEQRALAVGADIALFGHTHIPFCEYRDGLWLLNPGNAQQGNMLRFATIDIPDTGAVACNLCTISR